MSIPTQAMRSALKTVYSGRRKKTAWTRKVDRMSDEQVVAIYHRLQLQNKL